MFFQGTKGIARIKSWVLILVDSAGEVLDRADRELCMEEDEFAHRIGWTVVRTGFGSRRYRDPRFDRLAVPRNPEEVSGNVAA